MQQEGSVEKIDVSHYVKELMTKELFRREYSIVKIDVTCNLNAANNSIKVFSVYSIQMLDQDGREFFLNTLDANETMDEYTGIEWLARFIKQVEGKAVLKFGAKSLRLSENHTFDFEETPETAPYSIKRTSSFKLSFVISCNVSDFKSFFSNPDHFYKWTMSKIENGKATIDNIELRKIHIGTKKITLGYKWKGWDEYSDVEIQLLDLSGRTKVTILHDNVPNSVIDNVKEYWKIDVIDKIGLCFNCSISLMD